MPTNQGITVHEHNPNDSLGGGGCICSGRLASEECRGPWYNFFRTQTEFHQSPYAVICEYHREALNRAAAEDEVLTGGDPLPLRPASPVLREDTGMPAAEPTPYVKLEV